MGDCYSCDWYDIEARTCHNPDCDWYDIEARTCHNPDSDYLEYIEPDWGCTLWECDWLGKIYGEESTYGEE